MSAGIRVRSPGSNECISKTEPTRAQTIGTHVTKIQNSRKSAPRRINTTNFAKAVALVAAIGDLYVRTIDAVPTHAMNEQVVTDLAARVADMFTTRLDWTFDTFTRTQYRMLVLFLLGHKSARYNDLPVREEVARWLLPAEEQVRLSRHWFVPDPWEYALRCEADTVRLFYRKTRQRVGETDVLVEKVAALAVERMGPYREFVPDSHFYNAARLVCFYGESPNPYSLHKRAVLIALGCKRSPLAFPEDTTTAEQWAQVVA